MGSLASEVELGKKLQLARKRAGFTQQELCQKAGLSYSTLAKIERGAIKSPSVFTVVSIVAATGTTLEDLLDIHANDSGSPSSSKKHSKSGVRFVYFDIDGVLVHNIMHAFANLSRASSIEPEIIENAFWRHNDTACRGDMTIEQFNQAVAKETGIADFNWLDNYFAVAEATPGMAELLESTARNFEVGLISNHLPGETEQVLQRGLIPKVSFRAVIDSCDVGAVKPESKIFAKAQELAAVEPNEILLIDDLRPNLTAADKLGWQIQWFDENNPAASIEKIKKHLEF